jgi:radical SAM protein with 4Fe4S-binding SPASM domain
MKTLFNEHFVVNPNYFIRHDANRSIITDRYFKNKQIYSSDNFFSFIHPYHAELLSFFNGYNSVYEVANQFSSSKNFDLKNCLDFISKLLENKNFYAISIKNSQLVFPKNLLVKKSDCNSFFIYNEADFAYNNLDFETKRLNFPLYISYMINTKCKTDCIYCYADCRKRQARSISKQNIMKLLHEINKYKIVYFNIMGGEFFLDDDWTFFIQELKKIDLIPFISTKIPISNKNISELSKYEIKDIQISLDSIKPSILNKILKVNGEKYIKEMKQTLEELTKANIQIKINTVITKHNDVIEDIKLLLDFLSEFNVSQLMIIPAGFTLYKHSDFMPSLKSIQLIQDFIRSNQVNYSFKISLSDYTKKNEFCLSVADKEKSFSKRELCTGNINQVYILPNGDVTICEGVMFNKAFIMGNVNNKSLKEIWDDNKYAYLMNQAVYKGSACEKCRDFENCHSGKGVCWKLSVSAYGDDNFYYPDPRCPKAPQLINKIYID